MTLTEIDIDEIKKIVQEEIKHLPTRDEFYKKMDEIMGELQAIRQEFTISSHQLSEHEDRIQVLEKIHPQGQHATLAA